MTKRAEKINTVIVKELFKKMNHKKHIRLLADQPGDGFTYICFDGTRLHRLLNDDLFVDCTRIAKSNISKVYNDCREKNTEKAYYTGYTADRDGRQLKQFKAGENYYYYDEKILKEFGSINDLYLLVSSNTLAPAIVVSVEYYNNEIGLVCPVNY